MYELDLPVFDPEGLDRAGRIAALTAVQSEHWLARTPLGFAVTRYADVVTLLRERRFHSALSLLPQMQGIEDATIEQRRPSILSMEGDEHAVCAAWWHRRSRPRPRTGSAPSSAT